MTEGQQKRQQNRLEPRWYIVKLKKNQVQTRNKNLQDKNIKKVDLFTVLKRSNLYVF